MKNLIIIFLILIGLTSSVYAAQDVPLTDVDVLTLQKSVQNNLKLPLKFTDMWRYPKYDILKPNLQAYMCVFKMNGANKPDGAVIYYVNSASKIIKIKIFNYNNTSSEKSVVAAITAVIDSLDLTAAETADFWNCKDGVKNVWSSLKGRRFMLFEDDPIFVFSASS